LEDDAIDAVSPLARHPFVGLLHGGEDLAYLGQLV
jgi:hypothetical protein